MLERLDKLEHITSVLVKETAFIKDVVRFSFINYTKLYTMFHPDMVENNYLVFRWIRRHVMDARRALIQNYQSIA